MSWDASLHDDRGHEEGWWNYTHNTNGMANAVVPEDELREGARRWWSKRPGYEDVVAEIDAGKRSGSWWDCLDGMKGHEGAAFLSRIIEGLEADPERFRAMNPENGWGNYDDFLDLLKKMRDSVPESWPTVWTVSG